MSANFARLREILAEVTDLTRAAMVLEWDQETYMPPGGVEGRAEQMSTLLRLSHITFTSDEVGRLLEALESEQQHADFDSDEASIVRVTRRDYEQARRVSPELVAEIAHAGATTQPVWKKARETADWKLFAPNEYFVFGTDEFGRDILSRIVFGARISLEVGLISVSLALVLGASAGLLAGFLGGWLDGLTMRCMDVLFAFPAILLAIGIMAVLGTGIVNAMLAIGIVYAPSFARLARASVLSLKEMEFVQAARVLGLGELAIGRLSASPSPIRNLAFGGDRIAPAALVHLERLKTLQGILLGGRDRSFDDEAFAAAVPPGVVLTFA